MNYHTPSSFSDASAIAASSKGKTRFLAGGTDVLVQMRFTIFFLFGGVLPPSSKNGSDTPLKDEPQAWWHKFESPTA